MKQHPSSLSANLDLTIVPDFKTRRAWNFNLRTILSPPRFTFTEARMSLKSTSRPSPVFHSLHMTRFEFINFAAVSLQFLRRLDRTAYSTVWADNWFRKV